VIAIIAALGPGHIFSEIGAFFSKMAVVASGGAYAVLAYMAQQAVETYGSLRSGEMLADPGARYVRALLPPRLRGESGRLFGCLHGGDQLGERRLAYGELGAYPYDYAEIVAAAQLSGY
jgi:hypothetical protein